MSGSKWIRQFHRWISMIFTVTVILIFAILGTGHEPAQWVYYLPLPPLFLLLFSGLYLFALPYLAKRRAAGQQQS
jgi:ABC-type polysaccharide/polyol phosphate export permease